MTSKNKATSTDKTYWLVRHPFYTGALAVGVILMITFLSRPASSPGHSAHAAGAMVIPVEINELKRAPLQDTSVFMAQMNNDYSTAIHPQVSGRVLRVLVSEGAHVRAGQALLQLDASQQSAQVRSLGASAQITAQEQAIVRKTIQSLNADRDAARTELAFNQSQLKRFEALRETHTVSQKDVEQYQTTVNQLQNKVKSVESNLSSQTQRLNQARASAERDQMAQKSAAANLSFYTVRAPYAGELGAIAVKEGDVVDPSMMLTSLTNARQLEVEVAIPADYQSKLKKGNLLELLNTDGQVLSTARISLISPKVDPMSQTILVKAQVQPQSLGKEGHATVLLSDQRLQARLIWEAEQALMVPTAAVFRMIGQPFVYTAIPTGKDKQYKAHMVPVKLGDIHGDAYVVLSGLKAQQMIVTSGLQKLQEGVLVMPAPEQPEQKQADQK